MVIYTEIDIVDIGSQTNATRLQLQVVLHRISQFMGNFRWLQFSWADGG